MFAGAGASLIHNRLVRRVMREFERQLENGKCEPFSNDLRVYVPATGLFTYPDVVVVCGQLRLMDAHLDTLLNPSVIVEVLSPSTEAYDRGRKFEHYQSIESLQEYVLVATDRVHVDIYTRQPDRGWLLTSASRLEDSLALQSVDCHLRLADVYEKIDVSPAV